MRQIPFEIFKKNVIPPQEPCFPAHDWIRNTASSQKNDFFKFLRAQGSYLLQNLREWSSCIYLSKSTTIFGILPQKPYFLASFRIRKAAFIMVSSNKNFAFPIFDPKSCQPPTIDSHRSYVIYDLFFYEIRDQECEFGRFSDQKCWFPAWKFSHCSMDFWSSISIFSQLAVKKNIKNPFYDP